MPVPTIAFHRSKQLPKLIVTDLDGTLLNPQHTISPRSIKALSMAQSYFPSASDPTAAPIRIMIASGRSPRSIQKVIDLFNGVMMPDAVICCNGALNYNPRTRTISVPQFLPLDQTHQMIDTLTQQIRAFKNPMEQIPSKSLITPDRFLLQDQDQYKSSDFLPGRPGFACEVIYFMNPYSPQSQNPPVDWKPEYAQDTSFVCDKTWEAERKHAIYYEYTAVESMTDFIDSLAGRGGIVKLMALDRNRIAPKVYESLPNPLVHQNSDDKRPPLTTTYSGNYFLEIGAAGVSKGLGLSAYCEEHGILREDVVAFGDLLNDAEMLKYAGLGLCMGNGHEDMKKLADRVIGTNAEDGLAHEVETWFV
ncbi:hypothetical protein FBU30_004773 [Linnemannia zychae]|nr:hypothetical protein FBU30_004773 [Linnemannia zychae]